MCTYLFGFGSSVGVGIDVRVCGGDIISVAWTSVRGRYIFVQRYVTVARIGIKWLGYTNVVVA